jgi:hypothetical protein
MGLFDKIFKSIKINQTESGKYLTEAEIEERNKELMVKFDQVKNLFSLSLDIYNLEYCQCAYPRFQQIIGIDCSNTANSFKCYETDLLISMSKVYFDTTGSDLTDEVKNEKWICKKCGSTYEYGWSDFSIYVERQKLKLINLMVQLKGKPLVIPIPLCLGLAGHSYPSRSEITRVDFVEFESYMTEK